MLFNWIHSHVGAVILLALTVFVVSISGSSRLSITPDNRIFYGPSNHQFQDFLEFEEHYTPNNNILFVVSSSLTVAHPEYAKAIRWLDDQAWRITNVIRVDSIASYPVALGNEDSIEIVPLLDRLCPKNDGCQEDLGLLEKPQLVNRLISPDFRSTGIVATLSIEIGVVSVIEQITAETSLLATEFRSNFPDYELVVTGGIPMMQAFATSSQEDLSLLLPIALALILVLLVTFFGGALPALMLVATALASIGCTMGIAGWTGHTINSASSIAPLVVFTLVITSSMHIVIHYLRLISERPGDSLQAARAALEGNLVPMLVSAITTIAGLMSLSFLDSPPLRQLGYLSALGVLFGLGFTLLVLPLFLGKLNKTYNSLILATLQRHLNSYAKSVEAGRSLVSIGIAAVLISIVGIWNIQINDDFVKYFSKQTDFRLNTDRATELLAGPNHIEVLLTAREDGSVFDPSYITHLSALTNYLRDKPIVSSASSFSDVLQDLSIAFNRPLDVSVTSEELAQWYLVYELSLQRGQTNTDFVRADQHESRISVLLRESTSLDIQELEAAIYQWHRERTSDFKLLVTGENIPVAHLSLLNIRSMVTGILISILVTSLVVGLLVRNIRLGAVTLISTFLPIVCGFGIWGLLHGTIGLASTAIIALTIGIAVDDAVHMVYRYLDGRNRLDLEPAQAAAYSLHRVGTAITTTSVVMVGGLSALLFSNFEINSSFGACTCLIIAFALFFDLLVLPRFLVWADSSS